MPYFIYRYCAISDITGAFVVPNADGGLPYGNIAYLSHLLIVYLSLSVLKSKA